MTAVRKSRETHRPLCRVRKVAGWITNGLVTGIVLVAGLTWGRQLTAWWLVRTPHELRAGKDLDDGRGLGTSHRGWQHLDFPDLSVRLGRQTWLGSRTEALAALRERCRQQAARGGDAERQPGPDELQLLHRTANMTPVEQQVGQWRMYEIHEPMPLVILTDWGGPLGASQRVVPARVLVWGLALPVGPEDGEWTLFTYLPTAPGREAGS